jgi:hypothetical protein
MVAGRYWRPVAPVTRIRRSGRAARRSDAVPITLHEAGVSHVTASDESVSTK